MNDEGTTTIGVTESNDGGTTTKDNSGSNAGSNDEEDGSENNNDNQNDRRKRSVPANSTNKTKKTKNKLKRTNSASSVLGLNILLYQDLDDYYKPPAWESVVQNSYLGFKV